MNSQSCSGNDFWAATGTLAIVFPGGSISYKEREAQFPA